MALNNIGGKNITNKYYRQQKALAARSTRCAAFRAKLGSWCLMDRFLLIIFLSSLTFAIKAQTSIEECSEDIKPLAPLELLWPGSPSGGIEPEYISEAVTLKFIVTELGEVESIETVDTTSRIYTRVARRTIWKTKFLKPTTKCFKNWIIRYEKPRT
ncbi:MAG: hypothetical protein NWQ42_09510 [Alishewanella sp.]|nr:hypothetical protein [Alishewanella sp.]